MADDTEVRDPRRRDLSAEAARRRREARDWRQRAEAAEARLAELEGDGADDVNEDDETPSDTTGDTRGQGRGSERPPEADDGPPDHSLRIENAFLRHAHAAGIAEVDDAWKLIDQSMIEVSDEGEVEGMDTAVLALTTKYPSLKGGPQRGSPSPPARSSGKPVSHRQPPKTGYDTATLQSRFPALRRGR